MREMANYKATYFKWHVEGGIAIISLDQPEPRIR